MNIVRKSHLWKEVDGDALCQIIDAQSVFTAWEAAKKAAIEVQGGMFWRNQNGTDTSGKNSQKRLGRRSAENEAIHKTFIERRQQVETILANLSAMLVRHQRMNKALYVGRAPRILVDILSILTGTGLPNFTVVGDHAPLYAYETAAGVRLAEVDAKAALSLLVQGELCSSSFLGLLKKVDRTFEVRSSQCFVAVNSKGFEITIIQPEGKEYDLQPSDFFSSMIVSSTGSMARMRTISPLAFARFKRLKAGQLCKEPLKCAEEINLA
ncbi:MAG TPA: GSU2403 family nucleotidyltransferase fold protein [Desulfuromonadaceae bacterium]|jgi:hypothetical protein